MAASKLGDSDVGFLSDLVTDGASTLVAGESRAGQPYAHVVEPHEAVRISTGAMLPRGADAVLRVEVSEITTAASRLNLSFTSSGVMARSDGTHCV